MQAEQLQEPAWTKKEVEKAPREGRVFHFDINPLFCFIMVLETRHLFRVLLRVFMHLSISRIAEEHSAKSGISSKRARC